MLLFGISPNVNTGDAGELITAAHFLGIAHPSGYPLYLLIVKSFTFLPFGNIAFKACLVSVLFGALSICLVYRIVHLCAGTEFPAILAACLLLMADSFYAQAVIAKFYTLNLFLILSVFLLWLQLYYTFERNDLVLDKRRELYTQVMASSAFLYGLILTNHHTGVLVAVPIFWMVLKLAGRLQLQLNRNTLRYLYLSLFWVFILFLCGVSYNMYLVLRGEASFVNAFHVHSFSDMLVLISRDAYSSRSTFSLAKDLFSKMLGTYGSMQNLVLFFKNNFGSTLLIFAAPGVYYYFRKNKSLFLYLFLFFLMYGILMAILIFPTNKISELEYYITAHQYFLPCLAVVAILLSFGIGFSLDLLLRKSKQYMRQIVFALVGIMLVIGLVSRMQRTFRNNYVPYQHAKDMMSNLPVNSYFLVSGDNHRYQGRYVHLVGRYRDDICQLNVIYLQKDIGGFAECEKYSYSYVTPGYFKESHSEITEIIGDTQLYSNIIFPEDDFINKLYHAEDLGFLFRYQQVESELFQELENKGRESGTNEMVSGSSRIHYEVCSGNYQYDLFTNTICSHYQEYVQNILQTISSGK